MLTWDERAELADLAADYLDALHQVERFGARGPCELRQAEFLLVSLLMQLMRAQRAATFTCHGHLFALQRIKKEQVLHVVRLKERRTDAATKANGWMDGSQPASPRSARTPQTERSA